MINFAIKLNNFGSICLSNDPFAKCHITNVPEPSMGGGDKFAPQRIFPIFSIILHFMQHKWD